MLTCPRCADDEDDMVLQAKTTGEPSKLNQTINKKRSRRLRRSRSLEATASGVSLERFVDLLLLNMSDMRDLTEDNCDLSVFACAICGGVLYEPVTVACGHTYCRRCVATSDTGQCRKCGCRLRAETTPRVNVVVGCILEKCCPVAVEAARLVARGNELSHRRLLWQEALRTLQQARQLAPHDHMVQISLCRILLQLGRSEEALYHAERAVQLKRNWPEGYYRMAIALQSLGRYEEAIISYLQSLALGPDFGFVRAELTKLLHKTLTVNMRRYSLERRFSPYHLAPRSCCSSPESSAHNSDNSDQSSGDDAQQIMRMKPKKRRPRFLSCNISPERFSVEEKSKCHHLENLRLKNLIDSCLTERNKMKNLHGIMNRHIINVEAIDKVDFECTLCFRMFWQPVTTPCGHMFCRMCLDRCLDHSSVCPLCKTSLEDYLAERRQSTTEFVERVMQLFLPHEYRERRRIHEEEMSELARAGIDAQHEVPIFVCTMAFPTVPCPLHAFEPRYRLMIRQCLESGTKQFGMCPCFDDSDSGFADYGTMVEIREVQYFPDGRAIVDTVGKRRFKVVHKGMRDGYNTASVEFLMDTPIDEGSLNEVIHLHDNVHRAVLNWFNGLQDEVRQRILEHFGAMPELERDWFKLANGPAWCWWVLAILPLDKRAQLSILAMTSLRRRLEALQRVLNYLQDRNVI